MPLIDSAVLKVGAGNYFTAPVGTALPTDLKSPGSEWVNMGHTSLEDILAFESEGGEATVLGTLQARNLRTAYSARSETMSINIHQFDAASLKLYYGSNMVDVAGDGSLLGVPQDPQPTEAAFLAVYLDGANVFAYYAQRSEIFRGDDAEITNTEELAALPLTITPLVHEGADWAYAVTPLGTVSGS